MSEYEHAEHGEMKRIEREARRVTIEGWRCVECHVIGEDGRADEVFDNHKCEDYEEIRKGITRNL